MKKILGFALFIGFVQTISGQANFSRKDSLQGGLRPERTAYDVLRYDLNITINPKEKSITGYNDITFKTVERTSTIQVDLFENMQVDSILFQSNQLNYQREFDAVFIDFPLFSLFNMVYI